MKVPAPAWERHAFGRCRPRIEPNQSSWGQVALYSGMKAQKMDSKETRRNHFLSKAREAREHAEMAGPAWAKEFATGDCPWLRTACGKGRGRPVRLSQAFATRSAIMVPKGAGGLGHRSMAVVPPSQAVCPGRGRSEFDMAATLMRVKFGASPSLLSAVLAGPSDGAYQLLDIHWLV